MTVVPADTFPKNIVDGIKVSRPVAEAVVEPAPLTDSVVVGLEAFELKDTVPLAAPLACGLNVIVRGTLLPGATVVGN